MEKIMPESTIKYYPVIARILLLLGGLPLVTFRASIVSMSPEEVASYRMVHRFLMEYKGRSKSCSENNEAYVHHSRDQMLEYLGEKTDKFKRNGNKPIEPVVEVVIDLRGVTPTLAIAQEV